MKFYTIALVFYSRYFLQIHPYLTQISHIFLMLFYFVLDNNMKIELNLRLSLISTETWVVCPSNLNLNNGSMHLSNKIKCFV